MRVSARLFPPAAAGEPLRTARAHHARLDAAKRLAAAHARRDPIALQSGLADAADLSAADPDFALPAGGAGAAGAARALLQQVSL